MSEEIIDETDHGPALLRLKIKTFFSLFLRNKSVSFRNPYVDIVRTVIRLSYVPASGGQGAVKGPDPRRNNRNFSR